MCLAIPGKIERIEAEGTLGPTGHVNFGGIVKEVSLAYVPEVKVGDYVIVHVGFALSRVDEEEAKQVFEYLRQMDELAELASGDGGNPPASSPVGAAPTGKPPENRGP